MSAACRRFPTPSTMPSRSWARPISRCHTITGATGGRQRNWECLRRDNLLPSLHALLRVAGGVGGGGPSACSSGREFAEPPPTPDPSPPLRGGGEKMKRQRFECKENPLAMKTREEIAQALAASGYIADSELATAISLMQLLRRPLLLEGEAGVGKT